MRTARLARNTRGLRTFRVFEKVTLRSTSFDRFFFREPINGYVFEVIDQGRTGLKETV